MTFHYKIQINTGNNDIESVEGDTTSIDLTIEQAVKIYLSKYDDPECFTIQYAQNENGELISVKSHVSCSPSVYVKLRPEMIYMHVKLDDKYYMFKSTCGQTDTVENVLKKELKDNLKLDFNKYTVTSYQEQNNSDEEPSIKNLIWNKCYYHITLVQNLEIFVSYYNKDHRMLFTKSQTFNTTQKLTDLVERSKKEFINSSVLIYSGCLLVRDTDQPFDESKVYQVVIIPTELAMFATYNKDAAFNDTPIKPYVPKETMFDLKKEEYAPRRRIDQWNDEYLKVAQNTGVPPKVPSSGSVSTAAATASEKDDDTESVSTGVENDDDAESVHTAVEDDNGSLHTAMGDDEDDKESVHTAISEDDVNEQIIEAYESELVAAECDLNDEPEEKENSVADSSSDSEQSLSDFEIVEKVEELSIKSDEE